jgi:hypothetical protein
MMTVPNDANYYLPIVVQIPSALEITAISQANPMVVSTTMNSQQVNTYQTGQLVKLTIPFLYGMQQANGMIAQILQVTGSNLALNVNSTNFDPFSVPATGEMPAILAPSGSRNLQFSNNTNNIAFQSLNNIGN